MMHLRWVVIGVSLLMAMCSQAAPTVPTPVQTPVPTVQYILRWDRIAFRCEPRPLTAPVEPHATLTQSGNELTVMYVRPDDLLYVLFHRVDQEWWLCDWDTSDN